jgi:hypothetical protein
VFYIRDILSFCIQSVTVLFFIRSIIAHNYKITSTPIYEYIFLPELKCYSHYCIVIFPDYLNYPRKAVHINLSMDGREIDEQ